MHVKRNLHFQGRALSCFAALSISAQRARSFALLRMTLVMLRVITRGTQNASP